MIAGMLPMALAFGESGQQNAPLGRAVIGGLAAATFATLFVLPDRTPPVIRSVNNIGSTTVAILFSEPINSNDAAQSRESVMCIGVPSLLWNIGCAIRWQR